MKGSLCLLHAGCPKLCVYEKKYDKILKVQRSSDISQCANGEEHKKNP